MTLAALQAAVAAEDTVIQSAVTLLNGIQAQIAALTPDQAAIDALAADVQTQTQALSAAVAANTPAAPASGS
jgi:prefoldin subunit 5